MISKMERVLKEGLKGWGSANEDRMVFSEVLNRIFNGLRLSHRARSSCAALVGLCLFVSTCKATQPNLVFILADDLGFETVGCMGGESYQTPNLDQLASEGIRLDRAYAMPLCTNSRIQLMTGKYNLRNWSAFGILDPREPTFGTLLKKAGYKTCIAGKWQLTSYDPPDYPGSDLRRNTGVAPENSGFDEYSLWHVGDTENKGSRYADPVIVENGNQIRDTEGRYGPDLWSDFINDFVTRNQDSPFFVYYSMALPHNPMVPTPASPEWKDPASRHRDETRFAADMIQYTDKMVGKIVDHLDRLNLDRETLVIFYSDNGTNYRVTSNYRGRMVRGGKGKGTELGIRVPAIVRWTGKIQPGQVSDALFDTVDVLPTLLDAAGVKEMLPDDSDGFSFMNHFTRGSKGPRDWVFVHQDPRPGWDKDRFHLIRLALNQHFKLYEDGRLFDLQNDPYEETPRFIDSDDAERKLSRQELQAVLDSMSEYRRFDPSEVPRPNPSERQSGARFQDQGGCVVVEAELLPIPRDESWLHESLMPRSTGLGYLRALRDQKDSPTIGQTPIKIILDNAGQWRVAVRCRTDQPDFSKGAFWFQWEDQKWSKVVFPKQTQPGTWVWIDPFSGKLAESNSGSGIPLKERGNAFSIAPAGTNVKVDRVVIYQEDKASQALNSQTPPSVLHPWASP